MIARIDHVVIAVRDLEEAIRRYQALGFAVSPGGRHTGLGTYNAIVRFGLDYLELISIYDERELGNRGLNGVSLAEFLRRQEGGLVGYALATADIEEDAARFEQTGLEAEGPFAMQRLRPDGRQLSWRLLVPGGTSWRQPWPFLIQWDAPDDVRLTWEQPGVHPNGASGVAGIAVAVRDLERGIDLYQRQLGLTLDSLGEASQLAAQQASFHVGAFSIDLYAPTGAGPVQQVLDSVGEGPFELTLSSASLDQTKRFLSQHGISIDPIPERAATLALPIHEALGARIVLHQQNGS